MTQGPRHVIYIGGAMVTVSKEGPLWLAPTGQENFGFLTRMAKKAFL